MVKRTIMIWIGIFLLCAIMNSVVGAEEPANDAVEVEAKFFKSMEELKYPQVKLPEDRPFERKINKDFTNYIKESYKSYRKNEKQAKKQGFPADYQSDFEVKYNQNQKLSILTSDYKFAGGAHGSTIVQSFNYDLDDRKRVWLTDILSSKEKVESVVDFVLEYTSERPEIFFPDLKEEDIQLEKETAFYFTDDGIALVFQQYEVAPYASGNQEIAVPQEVYQ